MSGSSASAGQAADAPAAQPSHGPNGTHGGGETGEPAREDPGGENGENGETPPTAPSTHGDGTDQDQDGDQDRVSLVKSARPHPPAEADSAEAPDARHAADDDPTDVDADDAGVRVPSAHVSTDEPLLAARVHRPADLIRFLAGLLAVIAIFVVTAIAHNTTSGLEDDILAGTDKIPRFLITFTGFASSAAVLVVPLAFAVERLIKRDGLRVADGVLAAVLAHGLSLGIDLWVAKAAPDSITQALATVTPGSTTLTDPVHGYLAPVIAYMTAVGMQSRPRWRIALWVVVLLDGLAEVMGGYTTPLSVAVTIALGLAVAYGTLYAVGAPNVRPTGEHLLAGLRKVGFRPVSAHRSTDGPEGTRRYLVVQEEASPLDVHVIDREQLASGFFYRLWRSLRLRSVAVRSGPMTLREALEREALISYAATASGAASPRLIATSELGPDAAILVYERIDGRPLDAVPEERISEQVLTSAWRAVMSLHDRRIAHRRLTGESLLVREHDTTCLVNLAGGDIAAGELLLRMDIAQLLTTFALRVGPERAVESAAAVLGAERTASALPLLQPVALSRSTRAELRKFNHTRKAEADALHAQQLKSGEITAADLNELPQVELLSEIRGQILAKVPQAPVAPAKLERLRPRTLITLTAGAFAAYLLITTLGKTKPSDIISQASWGWVFVAVLSSALSYVAATMQLTGFVPEKVPFGRALLTQIAGSFVKLVAPAAVGGVALNTRFLQKAGVRPGQAVASVGASQLVGAGAHLLLLFGFGFVAGTSTKDIAPSRTVIAWVLVAAVLIMVGAAIPRIRHWASERLTSLFAGVVPRMLDLLQQPSKLATGLGGIVLITLTLAGCLDFCTRAFGGHLNYATVAAVYLTANAAGSAVPVPGGIGPIEASLSLALTAAGMPSSNAVTSVLLFRMLTFWLPVLPGWASYAYLQRKAAL
jgi:uncharacterized protein (TIRG00374 family)